MQQQLLGSIEEEHVSHAKIGVLCEHVIARDHADDLIVRIDSIDE